MAKRTRPLMMTGVALASATAIVTASPALVSTHDLAVAAAPSPLKLSTANVELTALTDITLSGINDAYWFGWGGYVGCGDLDSSGNCTFTPQDPYYPGVNSVYVTGAAGVAYYLADNIIDQFVPNFNLDNYYFEIGSSRGGGLPAVLYVASGEAFGPYSPIFTIAQSVFYYGVPNVINSLIVSLSSALPQLNIGPVTVGGGILASLYYTGSTPDGSLVYGTPGLSAILGYITTSITDSTLPASAATAASVKSAEAKTLSAATDAPADSTTPDATAPADTTPAATETATTDKAKADTTDTGKDTTATDTSATDTTKTAEDSTSPASGTTTSGGSSSSDSSSTGESSSTGDSSSTDVKTPAPTPRSTASAGPKPTKPENPLSKIGKKISDALSGKKSSDSGSGAAGGSGSGSSSSGS
jgi:hypothetical protein